nr:hypothetical protein [Tanacetum cinerariifolium]
MVEKSKLDEGKEGKAIDPSHYRGMIGSLLYLIVRRPDLQFAICMCARYQARPTKKHDSSVALTTFADADHAGCQDTRRSTSDYGLGFNKIPMYCDNKSAIAEASDFINKFLKMIQVRLKVLVRRIRTDNGIEFVNQTLRKYYEEVGISHETSVACSPQQNGIVKRRILTLIEEACTIENLGKLQLKDDIGIFIGYAPTKKAFRIYNRCTRRIVKTIHVDFDELTAMASEQSSSGPALNELTPTTIIDQDAPSPSKSQTTPETQSAVIPQDVEEVNTDIKVAHMGNDLPVSIRLQLHEQAVFCYYDAFLTSVEPKTYKDALTQSYWIEAMQEELNEFERLEVWELVPRPDKVMVITLK